MWPPWKGCYTPPSHTYTSWEPVFHVCTSYFCWGFCSWILKVGDSFFYQLVWPAEALIVPSQLWSSKQRPGGFLYASLEYICPGPGSLTFINHLFFWLGFLWPPLTHLSSTTNQKHPCQPHIYFCCFCQILGVYSLASCLTYTRQLVEVVCPLVIHTGRSLLSHPISDDYLISPQIEEIIFVLYHKGDMLNIIEF